VRATAKLCWELLWARSATLFAALCAVLAVSGCSGKGVAGSCKDIAACGGDPTGTWTIGNVCQFDVTSPPLLMSPTAPGYLTPQTPALADPAPNPTTAGDWCSGLIYLPPPAAGMGSPVAGIQFWPAPLAFSGGSVAFEADHNYTVITTLDAAQTTHFSQACLQAYGAKPSCAELTTGLQTVSNPNYQNLECRDASDGGCDCDYTLEGTGSDSGTWAVKGNQIIEYSSSSGKPPQAVDFCVDGSTLTLGGANGASLGTAGLRSLTATKQ